MNPPVVTFFNSKGGVGKSSLIFHLAWMYASLRKKVLVLDLDPQASLSFHCLGEEKIAEIWGNDEPGATIATSFNPAVGLTFEPVLQEVGPGFYLLPGDLRLVALEDVFSGAWAKVESTPDALRSVTSLGQLTQRAARQVKPDIILIDTAPTAGGLNRSVMTASDYVIMPLRGELMSLQGLQTAGEILQNWKFKQQKLHDLLTGKSLGIELPERRMEPMGYVLWQPTVRLDRPLSPYAWARQIPAVFRDSVLNEPSDAAMTLEEDPYCLGIIKQYQSLMLMGLEKRKPVFALTAADGAIGSHAGAVRDAKREYRALAEKIAGRAGLELQLS